MSTQLQGTADGDDIKQQMPILNTFPVHKQTQQISVTEHIKLCGRGTNVHIKSTMCVKVPDLSLHHHKTDT